MILSNKEWLIFTTIHIFLWVVVYRSKRRYTDSLDSFYFASGLYWLIFVFAPYVWIQNGRTAYQGVEVMKYMPEGMLVFNLGYLVYAISSVSNKAIVLGSRAQREYGSEEEFKEYLWSEKASAQLVRYGWILFGISILLALTYFARTGRGFLYMLTFGQGSEITIGGEGLGIYFLAQFSRSAIPGLLLVLAFQKKRSVTSYIAVYVLASMCITSGSRNLALCVVISVAVMIYFIKGKRPKVFALILAVVLMFLFVGFVGIFRDDLRTGGKINLSLLSMGGMIRAFMFNVEIFFPFFNLVGYTFSGKIKCHYGLGILNIPLQFIPRAIWSSKPATLGKTAFQAMYGSSFDGAAYPNIGEFFYELGIIGVVVFMYIFGKKMKNLYIDATKNANPLSIIQYSLAYGYLMQFLCRGHFASWALDFFFMFVPILIIRKIMYRQFKSSVI